MSHYGLENHGIVGAGKVHWNLPVAPLVEEAVRRGEADQQRRAECADG